MPLLAKTTASSSHPPIFGQRGTNTRMDGNSGLRKLTVQWQEEGAETVDNISLLQDKNGRWYFIVPLGTADMPIYDLNANGTPTLRYSENAALPLYPIPQILPKHFDPESFKNNADTQALLHHIKQATREAYQTYLTSLPIRGTLPATNHYMANMSVGRAVEASYIRPVATALVGGPGLGKTHTLSALQSISHPDGGLFVDFNGDSELSFLFREVLIDTSSATAYQTAMDGFLRHKLPDILQNDPERGQTIITQLRSMLGNAFTEDQGVAEWTSPATLPSENATPPLAHQAPSRFAIDWDRLHINVSDDILMAEDQTNAEEAIRRALESFETSIINFLNDHGFSIQDKGGLLKTKERDGVLVRVFDPESPDYGKPVLLDELGLVVQEQQAVLRAFAAWAGNSESRPLRVRGANGRVVTLDRQNIPPSVHVAITANPPVAGMGANAIDVPLLDRLGRNYLIIPDATRADLADVAVRYIAHGLPLAVMMDAFPLQDRTQVANYIQRTLMDAMGVHHVEQLPEAQRVALENISNTVKLAHHIATVIQTVTETISGIRDTKLRSYLEQKMPGSGQRTIISFMQQADRTRDEDMAPPSAAALLNRSSSIGSAFRNAGDTPSAMDQQAEHMASRGDKLEFAITQWIESIFSIPDAKTQRFKPEALTTVQEEKDDIVRGLKRQSVLDDGNRTKPNTIRSLYNTITPAFKTRHVRALLADIATHIQGSPLSAGDIDPEILLQSLSSTLATASGQQLTIPHPPLASDATSPAPQSWFQNVMMTDALAITKGLVQSAISETSVSHLMDADVLVAALTSPETHLQNINSVLQTLQSSAEQIKLSTQGMIFPNPLVQQRHLPDADSNSPLAPIPDTLLERVRAMATGVSTRQSSLVVTTLLAEKGGKPVHIQLIHQKNTEQTLLVTDTPISPLAHKIAAQNPNVIVIDQLDRNSIGFGLSQLDMNSEERAIARLAMQVRNRYEGQHNGIVSLEELMATPPTATRPLVVSNLTTPQDLHVLMDSLKADTQSRATSPQI